MAMTDERKAHLRSYGDEELHEAMEEIDRQTAELAEARKQAANHSLCWVTGEALLAENNDLKLLTVALEQASRNTELINRNVELNHQRLIAKLRAEVDRLTAEAQRDFWSRVISLEGERDEAVKAAARLAAEVERLTKAHDGQVRLTAKAWEVTDEKGATIARLSGELAEARAQLSREHRATVRADNRVESMSIRNETLRRELAEARVVVDAAEEHAWASNDDAALTWLVLRRRIQAYRAGSPAREDRNV